MLTRTDRTAVTDAPATYGSSRWRSLLRRMQGRLYRKFATLLVALVASALVVTSLVGSYYSYHENQSAQAAIQREKVQGAAAVIEQFLREIESQLGWTTHPALLPGAADPSQRRLDFLRLLRQAPAITEVAHVDADGREQLRVSRLAMDVAASGADRSQEPAVREALARRRYVSPVYFRKESEPYLTLAITGASRRSGVTIAEVNLKFIWDVISRIKVGRTGIAYAVDDRGLLIAHPDIGLVLRKTDLSALEQVRSAVAMPPGSAPSPFGRNLSGVEVLSTSAVVQPVGWRVFVELPIAEAYAPIYDSLLRTLLLSLVGLGVAAVAGLWLTQRLVVPIEALAAGASRIGAGDLGHRISVATGDEVEALAARFNDMGARLKESYAGLERKVEERTKELAESLEYQTATSDVLAVISRSPSDVQPVLEAIVATAAGLCEGFDATLLLRQGDRLVVGAHHGTIPLDFQSKAITPHWITGRAVIEAKAIHVVDFAEARDEFPEGYELHRRQGHRTGLAIPLLRKGEAIGAFMIRRIEVSPFTDKQITVLQTFADQAVIAIENARLFEEVQARTRELTRSVSEMKALSEVGQAVSSSLDLKTVLGTILEHACAISHTAGAAIYVLEPSGRLVLEAGHNMSDALLAAVREHPLGRGDPVVGECASIGQPVQLADIETRPDHPLFETLHASGFRALLAVPLIHQEKTIGVLVVRRNHAGQFDPETVQLLQTFASQSSIAINNARLFREIEEKSRQLEVASRHKSQFLANMSHELRTPLNAILGYTELIQDGVYGAPQPRVTAVLDRVQINGRHLLGLINDVLDLSKIEAGQIELRLEDYSMSDIVQTVVTATGSLAAEKRIDLSVDVAAGLPAGRGDSQRITQVLLNLVGNAIKFTELGFVRIAVETRGERFRVKVDDSGPGIPESEHQRIFDEFHQVDSSNTKKKGGTGLGLAISKRIAELHGGRISVESEPGQGASFRLHLPIRVNEQRGLA